MAELSQHTYDDPTKDTPSTPLPPGYRMADDNDLAKLGLTSDELSPPKSSFHAEVFVKDEGPNSPQYVVAFRGTRLTDAEDWVNNAANGMSLPTEAYEKAENLAYKVADSSQNFIFTGHSLGGGLIKSPESSMCRIPKGAEVGQWV